MSELFICTTKTVGAQFEHCACVHPDARTCFEIRYPAAKRRNLRLFGHDFEEECQCGCHLEHDEDEEAL